MYKFCLNIKSIQMVLLISAVTLFFAQPASAYNSANAKEYADLWWDGRNPDYHDYSSEGGDCANYVSQCLIAGGMNLSQDENIPAIHKGVGGTIVNCDSLNIHVANFQHAEVTFGTSASHAPSNLGEGDIVIFGYDTDTYRHAAIVVSGNGGNAILAAHSGDNDDIKIDNYLSWMRGEYGSAHITYYHFSKYSETGQEQVFYGTGNYYGENTLIDIIMLPGLNYEGYITDSTDDSEQDLVVGEDTSQLNGCAHFIKAYCSDAHKGIPNDGLVFGQPWTSFDPNHWAYWARTAVVYANQNNYSSRDTFQAIWYITDRSGSYNQILTGIGYAYDGPDKNITGYQPALDSNSIKLYHNKFNPLKNETVSIVYTIVTDGPVSIKIYTIDGALVKTILNNHFRNAGRYVETWDGRNELLNTIASGIYFLHIEAPGFQDTKKICVIK